MKLLVTGNIGYITAEFIEEAFPGSHSFWWIFDVFFAQFLDIWFHGVFLL